MDDQNQRELLKYLFTKTQNASEAHRELKNTYGKSALELRTVQRWFKKFNSGQFDVEEHRGGNRVPQSTKDDQVKKIEAALVETRDWTLLSLATKTSIPATTCWRILHQILGMDKRSAQWVPYELNADQKKMRVIDSAANIKTYNRTKSSLDRTFAIDETWMPFHRPPEKDQNRRWLRTEERAETVPMPDRYSSKRMVIFAMDFNGICYYEILDQKETVNSDRYLEFLKNLVIHCHINTRRKNWILDDNARPHRTRAISEWMDENNFERWKHPAYSPDLSPCDYGCFHQLKRAIGGVPYADVNELKNALDSEIKKGNEDGKYRAVQRLPERWERCVNVKGEYI